MAIILTDEIVNRVDKIGDDDFSLSSGQFLRIETSPDGEEILNVQVPVGKSWNVHVAVVITETNI